ncbi:hypothetical protein [Bacteroides sp.]|uniref:hypothetical protein n=1 Tax=Bacteroides sp. TaxID=29523 RepID=UPI003AB5728B
MKTHLLKWHEGVKLEVWFSYTENYRVFKAFSVEINGKKSNWTGLKKYLECKERPRMITVNTHFGEPEVLEKDRHRSERHKVHEIEEFFNSISDVS